MLEGCLLWNGNIRWPDNIPANLCKTEYMVSDPSYKYRNLNFYYCLGYGPSALINQMTFDSVTRDCLNIGNMKKAEECLE